MLVSVLDLVQPHAPADVFARRPRAPARPPPLGPQPPIDSPEERLAFLLQHPGESGHGGYRHSIVDSSTFQAFALLGTRQVVNVGPGDVRNDSSPQPDELFVHRMRDVVALESLKPPVRPNP